MITDLPPTSMTLMSNSIGLYYLNYTIPESASEGTYLVYVEANLDNMAQQLAQKQTAAEAWRDIETFLEAELR